MTKAERCERDFKPIPFLIKRCWDIDPVATAMQLMGSTTSAVGNLTEDQWKECIHAIMANRAVLPPEMNRHELNALRAMRGAHKEFESFLKSSSIP